MKWFNKFLANVPILWPLKSPENQRFSGIFRGHEMGTLTINGLTGRYVVIPVNGLKLGINVKAYSEPCQTFKMEHFAKIVSSCKPLVIFAKSSTLPYLQSLTSVWRFFC